VLFSYIRVFAAGSILHFLVRRVFAGNFVNKEKFVEHHTNREFNKEIQAL
jgi:hypothetical protein